MMFLRQYFSKMYGRILCLCLLPFAFLITSSQLNNLKGGSARSIVDDLIAGNRGVFAVGLYHTKLTLFVSGTASKTDPIGGYQVTVDEVVDSVIVITKDPEPLPSSIPSNLSVKFVCSDVMDTYLVEMSNFSVGAYSLGTKNYSDIWFFPYSIPTCFRDGFLHVSSITFLRFFLIDVDAQVTLYKIYTWNNDVTIRRANECAPDKEKEDMGILCINGDRVFFSKEKCNGATFTNLISGFVDEHTVYLFDSENTVYTFSARAFQKDGPSTKLFKVSRKDAWKGPGDKLPPSKSKTETSDSTDQGIPIAIIVTTSFLILLIIGISFVVYCFFCSYSDENKKKKNIKKKSFKSKKKITGSFSKKKKVKRSSKKGRSSRSCSRGGRSSSNQKKIISSRRSSAGFSH